MTTTESVCRPDYFFSFIKNKHSHQNKPLLEERTALVLSSCRQLKGDSLVSKCHVKNLLPAFL